jgi:hypothetical protein
MGQRYLSHFLPILTGFSLLIPQNSVSAAIGLNLTTWQTFGDGSLSPNQALLSNDAIQGDDFDLGAQPGAFNFSGTPAGDNFTGDLEDFLGLASGTLNQGGEAYEGSAIKTTLTVQAGDVLAFQWNFLTNETASVLQANRGRFGDFAFFQVGQNVIQLANVNNFITASSPFDGETGVSTYNYTFTQSGAFTVAFGVADIDDYVVSSGLSVRQVELQTTTAVPEPLTLFGSGTALAFGAAFKRSLRKPRG